MCQAQKNKLVWAWNGTDIWAVAATKQEARRAFRQRLECPIPASEVARAKGPFRLVDQCSDDQDGYEVDEADFADSILTDEFGCVVDAG